MKLPYGWLDPLFELGNRRFLKLEDLPSLPSNFKDVQIHQTFSNAIGSTRIKDGKKLYTSLIQAFTTSFGRSALITVLFKLTSDACILMIPFVLREFIAWSSHACESGSDCNREVWRGLALVIGLLVLQLGQSVFGNMHLEGALKVAFQVRTALTHEIFRKSTTISKASQAQYSTDYIISLIENDCNKIATSLGSIHTLYSAPLIITLSLIMLYSWLGKSAFIGVFFIFVFVYMNSFAMQKLSDLFKVLSLAANRRVKETREAFTGFKALKLAVMENAITKKILRLRRNETRLTQMYLLGKSSLAGMTQIVPFSALTLTLGAYYLFNATDKPEVSFVLSSVTVFQSLRVPMILFPQVVAQAIDALNSLQTISAFLAAEDRKSLTQKLDTSDSKTGSIRIPTTSFKLSPSKGIEGLKIPKPISIQAGALVAVIGPTGSGKSLFMSALAGDLEPNGPESIGITGVSTVSSSPAWLFNGSVADNITFGGERRSLSDALKFSRLEKDVAGFKDKEDAAVGENGAVLSGGQRNRVGLARAVYSNADIILMDEPLLGIDASVAHELFHDTILNKWTNKTRIIATTHFQFLHLFDRIIVMNDLSVVEDGTFENLKKNPDSFVNKLIYTVEADTSVGKATTKASFPKKEGNMELDKKPSKPPIAKGSRNMFMEYSKAAGGLPPLVVIAVLVLGTQFLRVLTDSWLISFIKRQDSSSRFNGIALFLVMGVAQVFSILVQGGVIGAFALKASDTLHRRALEGLMNAPYKVMIQNPVGAVTSRFSKDLMDLDTLLPETIRILFFTLSLVLFNLFTAAFSNYTFLGVLIPTLMYLYSLQKYYRKSSKQMKRLENMERGKLNGFMVEMMTGRDTIRRSNAFTFFEAKFASHLDRYNTPIFLFFHMQRWLSIRLEMGAALLSSMTALLCFVDVVRWGTTGMGWGGMTLVYCLSISASLTWCVRQVSETERLMMAGERLVEFAGSLGREEYNGRELMHGEGGNAIEFKGVSVKYHGDSDRRAEVEDISVIIPAGAKVGVAGRTGSGKTTLVSTLVKLVDVTNGRIEVDGVDVKDLTANTLRSSISLVSQDPFLFSGTIRFNLDPYDKVKDGDIWDLLTQLGLSQPIKSLKNGLHSMIIDRPWSSGEQQLLCFARSILRSPKTLILDESTSALDIESESAVQRVLSLYHDLTVIVVSHRVEFLERFCETIVVLDGGRVVEAGSAGELKRKVDGHFKLLLERSRMNT